MFPSPFPSKKEFYTLSLQLPRPPLQRAYELWNELILNLNPLYSVGAILLRHKSVKPFNNFAELSRDVL